MPAYLRDNVKARLLLPSGEHQRFQPAPGDARHRCQEELLHGRVAGLPPVAEPHVQHAENGVHKTGGEAAHV
jgi:hypothetical protein